MWVYTKNGFVSIVQVRGEPRELLVRARRREDLEAFVGSQYVKDIEHTPAADYEYRIELGMGVVAALAMREVMGIDYPNFKGAAARDPVWGGALHRIWAETREALDHRLDDALAGPRCEVCGAPRETEECHPWPAAARA